MLSFQSLTLYTLVFSFLLLGNLLIILLDSRIVEPLWRRCYRYLYPIAITGILFIENSNILLIIASAVYFLVSFIILIGSRNSVYIPRIKKVDFSKVISPIIDEIKSNNVHIDEIFVDSNEKSIIINEKRKGVRKTIVDQIEQYCENIKNMRRKQVAETGILTGIFCGIIIFYTVVVQSGRIIF